MTDYEMFNGFTGGNSLGWESDEPAGLVWRTVSTITMNRFWPFYGNDKWGYVLTVNQTGVFNINFKAVVSDHENFLMVNRDRPKSR